MPQEKRADSQKCSTTQKRKSKQKEARIHLTECVLFFYFLRKPEAFTKKLLLLEGGVLAYSIAALRAKIS
ncbi:MAG: hypothetical protein IJ021_04165, partial [Clostridia bacterium]|nr:hypothetical protein [Clostridia bacterium]